MSQANTNVIFPSVPVVDKGGNLTRPWLLWFLNNISLQDFNAAQVPVYFGTNFPVDASVPSILLKLTPEGAFDDIVVRTSA